MMETFYKEPQSHSVDKTWLSCLSVVLALGESYNDRVAPSFFLHDRMDTVIQAPTLSTSQHASPPGVEFFEQGLLLFKPSYEEPTVGQIEVLNLIVSLESLYAFIDKI